MLWNLGLPFARPRRSGPVKTRARNRSRGLYGIRHPVLQPLQSIVQRVEPLAQVPVQPFHPLVKPGNTIQYALEDVGVFGSHRLWGPRRVAHLPAPYRNLARGVPIVCRRWLSLQFGMCAVGLYCVLRMC